MTDKQDNPPQKPKLFGTDGIRGTVCTYPLVPDFVVSLGAATGTVMQKSNTRPIIIVGRDTRQSGEMLQSALTAGLPFGEADADNPGHGSLTSPPGSWISRPGSAKITRLRAAADPIAKIRTRKQRDIGAGRPGQDGGIVTRVRAPGHPASTIRFTLEPSPMDALPRLLDGVTPQQREAITHVTGPLLVLERGRMQPAAQEARAEARPAAPGRWRRRRCLARLR